MILSGRIQYFVSYCHREALSGIASHIVIYASSTITLDSQTCSESLLNLDLKQYCSVLTVIWGESTHWLFSLSRMFNPCGPMSSQIGCLQNNYCSPPYVNTSFLPKILFHIYMPEFEIWSLSGRMRTMACCFWHGGLFWLDAHAIWRVRLCLVAMIPFCLALNTTPKECKALNDQELKNCKTSDKNDCFNYNSNTVFTLEASSGLRLSALEAPGYASIKIQFVANKIFFKIHFAWVVL